MAPAVKKIAISIEYFFTKKSTLLFIVFLCLFTTVASSQIRINVTGSWSKSVPRTDVVEAGNDLSGNYTSGASVVKIDVSQRRYWDNFSGYDWRIDVSKVDIDWDNTLSVYARRTGNGLGYPFWFFYLFGAISGGTNFQQITDVDQAFFNGTNSDLDIPIQYRIRGASLTLPAKTYSTTIVYTVTEL